MIDNEHKQLGKRGPKVWDCKYLVDIYIFAKSGLQDKDIVLALGTNPTLWNKWLTDNEIGSGIKYAIEKGREAKKDLHERQTRFKQQIYEGLPDKVKSLWDQIFASKDKVHYSQRMQVLQLLDDETDWVRQQWFICALLHFGFSQGDARRYSGVDLKTLEKWKKNDKFTELLYEIQETKKDEIEDSIRYLVTEERNPFVSVFAAKTQARDRGFKEVSSHEIDAQITHLHVEVPWEDLITQYGTSEVKKQCLELLRWWKKKQAGEQVPALPFQITIPTLPLQTVVDAEIVQTTVPSTVDAEILP
jgi:hypothetical protein